MLENGSRQRDKTRKLVIMCLAGARKHGWLSSQRRSEMRG